MIGIIEVEGLDEAEKAAKEILKHVEAIREFQNTLYKVKGSTIEFPELDEKKRNYRPQALAKHILEYCEREKFTLYETDILLRDITFATQDARRAMMKKNLFSIQEEADM